MGDNVIYIQNLCFTNWDYSVRVQTHSPVNVWEEFRGRFIELDDHYLVLGIKGYDEHLSQVPDILAIRHTPEEAADKLYGLCKQEAERLKDKFNATEIRDRIK
ncbi:hypothetical protein CMI42_00705 [Candidatus Pacearchaeota archaeon]|nr:hypothetical protein [Candidatus Pacearchaeota archaeon]|tara:strand:+ start:541 stop:849 length:309 start_codon:yes stop_codon:yes gene_type:complete